MANFVLVFLACALFVAFVSGASEVQGIGRNETPPVLSEKGIEDFTDSEYIPVDDKEIGNTTVDLKGTPDVPYFHSNDKSPVLSGKEIEESQDEKDSEYIPVEDKENANATDDSKDESSTKFSTSSPLQSTASPEVKVSASTSENELKNTMAQPTSSVTDATSTSNEKTPSSLVDTSEPTEIATDRLSSTFKEKQHTSTEDLNISGEASTSTLIDTSANLNDTISKSMTSTNFNEMNSTSAASTGSDDAISSSDDSNNIPASSSVSGIGISQTSGITTSFEISSTVADISSTNPDSTLGEVSSFSTPTDAPIVSKDVSAITSSPKHLKSSTVISLKSTSSTMESVSDADITVTRSEATSVDVETDKPHIDKSTTVIEKTSRHSSEITTSSVVTESHLQHIGMPGLKKIKMGLAIAFLTISVIAMAGIITCVIKMRKTTVDYEELSLVP